MAVSKIDRIYLGGYSTISFIGLYLLAKYIRIYSPRWTELDKKTDVLIIVAITVFTTVICVIGPLLGTSAVYGYIFLTYVSPTTIFMAAMTLVLFSKLNFKSRLVNRLATSSFAVYLIFVNPNILSRYGHTFDEIHSFCNIAYYWAAVIAICIILYLAVAVADTIRIRIWNTIIYRKKHI